MLTLKEVQKIVNTILKEMEINDEFKSLVFNDVEKAIQYIIKRDFSSDTLRRYNQTVNNYNDEKKMRSSISKYFI